MKHIWTAKKITKFFPHGSIKKKDIISISYPNPGFHVLCCQKVCFELIHKNAGILRSILRSSGCSRDLLFYFLFSNSKNLFHRTNLAIFRRSSVAILLSSHCSNLVDNASSPSACGILEYKPTTSAVTNIVFGNLPSLFSFFIKLLVFFIYDSADCIKISDDNPEIQKHFVRVYHS